MNRLLVVLAVVFCAACPQPEPPSGVLTCDRITGGCPRGYMCLPKDNRCYALNERPDLRGAGVPDMTPAADLASSDAKTFPAARVDQCERICTCLMATCENIAGYPKFGAGGLIACADECLNAASANLQCREDHCGFAKAGSPDVHCFHARGLVPPGGSMACE